MINLTFSLLDNVKIVQVLDIERRVQVFAVDEDASYLAWSDDQLSNDNSEGTVIQRIQSSVLILEIALLLLTPLGIMHRLSLDVSQICLWCYGLSSLGFTVIKPLGDESST